MVVIGYAEKVEERYADDVLDDIYTSHIGGLAVLPYEYAGTIECDRCHVQMTLLVQLFAPEGEDKPFAKTRVVYLFTCLDNRCATKGWSKSLKAFRAQATAIKVTKKEGVLPLYEVISDQEPELLAEKSKKSGYEDKMSAHDGVEKYTKVKGDSTFHKFNKRLARASEQVIRYYRSPEPLTSSHATTLWIAEAGQLEDSKIAKCSCGSPRSIEFQVLPTILNYLDIDDTKTESLDFGVLCVYTCDAACERANTGLVEELVWRQESDPRSSIF